MAVLQMLVSAMIPGCRSLKEKRMVVKSIKDRMKNRFNVAVSELDFQEKRQKTMLGFVTLGKSSAYCNRTMDLIENQLVEDGRMFIIQVEREELL